MQKRSASIDYVFLIITGILVISGIFVFFSASLGVLAKSQNEFYSMIASQLGLGLLGGILAMLVCIKIPSKFFRDNSLIILIASILITALVFVPHLGITHGGARRWISIFGFSFQPVELLKISFVIYLSAWLSWAKKRTEKPLFGIVPLAVLLGIVASVLVFQPDTKSLILMSGTGIALLFLSGTPFKHIAIFFVCVASLFIIFALRTPYLQERVSTFISPSSDPTGNSYQLQQSLIAIGSGGLTGRGFGQSIQKFSYLPEPQGDSIFAIICEEFGLIGGTITIILYILFFTRGLYIARRASDAFSGLLATGLVILITLQAFMNITSITGLFPLTGVPLVFMSQGGTSLLVSLASVGMILAVSKNSMSAKKKRV